MDTTRILIIDDHHVVLRGLVQIVRDTLGENAVIHTASSGTAALRLLDTSRYDLCILDIELPDVDGIELMHTICRTHPSLKIIVHTLHEQVWFMKEFLKAEIHGVLFKDSSINEIAQALTSVLAGNKFFSHTARVLKNSIDEHAAPTQREMEVLQMLAAGATTDEISQQLGISTNTTESHRRHLLEKFRARNVAELILRAVAEGFLRHKHD